MTVPATQIDDPRGASARIDALIDRLPLGALCALFAVYVGAMGVGATLFEAGRMRWGQLDLDAEWRTFAFASGAVLLVAAGLVVLARRHALLDRSAIGVAALLVFMGVDEVVGIHERLEKATGVDWQLLYLPLVLAAAVGAVRLLRDLRRARGAAALFVAGGVAWGIAQVLERLQWRAESVAPHYVAMMIPEELLEISGSFLLALALVVLVRGRPRAPSLAG